VLRVGIQHFFRQLTTSQSTPYRHGIAPESDRIAMELRQRLFRMRRGRVYRLLFVIAKTEVSVLRVRGPGQAPLAANDLKI